MSPFDFINQINHGKTNLIDEKPELEKEYKPFIINRGLSFNHDTVLYANEMNFHNHADSKLQFDFFLNSIRPKKRFSKWLRSSKIKNLEYVKEYYGYSNEKAKQALEILNNDQLEEIKTIISRGGKHGKT